MGRSPYDPITRFLQMANDDPNQPHLKRVLGRFDLVLLFVVAVFNLNVVPSIAANGGVTVWLWIISLLLFFWPQGIAVIELAHRYPGEGGVYLWAKEVFGDFHGFLSGWCYWTNNMLYVPTVMLYFVGVGVFAMGPGHAALADNKNFAMIASLALLTLLRASRRSRTTVVLRSTKNWKRTLTRFWTTFADCKTAVPRSIRSLRRTKRILRTTIRPCTMRGWR